ncbi:hypothetical protein I302_101835 [Kwoniella bestiolae CBS 10118]|uniref:Uncharacterized protein n=1 Tax=Kwoniella bestiolae CBS 10118 TaxID=1296100 RepID=A0AAJ8K2Q2_9TREE
MSSSQSRRPTASRGDTSRQTVIDLRPQDLHFRISFSSDSSREDLNPAPRLILRQSQAMRKMSPRPVPKTRLAKIPNAYPPQGEVRSAGIRLLYLRAVHPYFPQRFHPPSANY